MSSVYTKISRYIPKVASQLKQEQADRYAEELERISQELGYLTPEIVVERAADPENPLHDYFEWDDKEAAERYRKVQARQLMRSIILNIKQVTPEEHDQAGPRAFQSVRTLIGEGEQTKIRRVYMHTDVVLKRPELAEQVADNMFRELVSFYNRYQNWLGTSKQFGEVNEALQRLIDGEAVQKLMNEG